MPRCTISAIFLILAACQHSSVNVSDLSAQAETGVYWSDGDSGRLNGVAFRLANVDAPETGGVGARGGAKCEAERVRGLAAKAFMEALTREATMAILKDFGMDRYGRRVVNLRANDHDVSLAGLRAGHLAAWPHRSQRALGKKPDWCQTVPTMRDPENFDN